MRQPARSRGDERGALASSSAAAAAALAILAAAVYYVATGGPDPSESATPSSTPSPTPSPTATVTSGSPTPTATPTPTPTGSVTTSPSPRPTVKPVNRSAVTVDVYNNTSTAGLAGSTADRVERRGWDVGVVANWRGSIPATTVYYPAGMRREALQLAEDFSVGRVRPATSAMSARGLSLILTGPLS